jgi:hypothetical protein
MTTRHLTPAVGDWIIDTSWAVFGANTKQIGTVDDVFPGYLVVTKGRLFRRERYIPVSRITSIERQCVYLNVSSAEIDDRGWNRTPELTGSVVVLDDAAANSVATGYTTVNTDDREMEERP